MIDEDDETKANLDPIPAVDPGLPALADKFVPVPAILRDLTDDVAVEYDEPPVSGKDAAQMISRHELGAHVANYARAKSEKGKTLTDLMVEISLDDTFKQLLSNAL